MCHLCVDLDEKIQRYQRIVQSILDQVTVDRAKELIAGFVAQKAALHPSEPQSE